MKKFLSLILTVCMCLLCGVAFTACKETPPPATVTYTVTEAEWKINFNLTKSQTTPQQLSTKLSQSLVEITSYTITATGVNDGKEGTCILKVAPNALTYDFSYPENDMNETYDNTTSNYIGLTASIMSYFPFADHYNDFTFDDTKKAYVAQNLTSAVVNEEDINDTYDMYTKSAEVSFINGYLNTITVELCDETFENVYSSFVFTFSNINNTTVDVQ